MLIDDLRRVKKLVTSEFRPHRTHSTWIITSTTKHFEFFHSADLDQEGRRLRSHPHYDAAIATLNQGLKKATVKTKKVAQGKKTSVVEMATQTRDGYDEEEYQTVDRDTVPGLPTGSGEYGSRERGSSGRPTGGPTPTTLPRSGMAPDMAQLFSMMVEQQRTQQRNMEKLLRELALSHSSKLEDEKLRHEELIRRQEERERQERERHEEEIRRREEYNREEARRREEAERKQDRLRAIQLLLPMSSKADLAEYLQLFESTAKRKELPAEDWSPTIITLLNDRFRGTTTKLPSEIQEDYEMLKTALLERDAANSKNASSTFWTVVKKKGTTALEYSQTLRRLATRFVNHTDIESVMDSFVKERFIQELPKEGRMYIRQREPKTTLEATKLADDYFHFGESSYASWSSEQSEPSHTHHSRERHSHKRRSRDYQQRQTGRGSPPRQEDRKGDSKDPPSDNIPEQADQGSKKTQGTAKPRKEP